MIETHSNPPSSSKGEAHVLLSPSKEIAEKRRSQPVTISEFARLMVILKTHPSARSALVKSQLGLSRRQLQNRETPYYFWTGVVEEIFNDEKCKPHWSFSVVLPNSVLPSAKTLQYRHGDELKNLSTISNLSLPISSTFSNAPDKMIST